MTQPGRPMRQQRIQPALNQAEPARNTMDNRAWVSEAREVSHIHDTIARNEVAGDERGPYVVTLHRTPKRILVITSTTGVSALQQAGYQVRPATDQDQVTMSRQDNPLRQE